MTDTTLSAPPTPFKGLAPFGDSDLDMLLFFGREREIEVIAANLVAARLTLLYGPSGVGKTSLLRAGVLTRLRRDEAAAVVVHSNWSRDSIDDLLRAMEGEARRVRPAVSLDFRGRSLADALADWRDAIRGELYVILDQFEEYFLYHESGGPFDQLAEIIGRREHRANFLISIREDSLARLDDFKTQIPNLFGNSLRLDRLDRSAATRAILGPLERYNELAESTEPVLAEDELVEEILDSVRAGQIQIGVTGRGSAEEAVESGRIEAPYLQLVLERMWNVERERGSARLRVATLRELGGATRIVEEHLERAMSILSPQEQDAAAAMYNHLVTPSGTKIAHRAGDLARYASVDEAEAERVLDQLASERIVRAAEDGAAGPQYEIFHDVLADAVLAWRTRHEGEKQLQDERREAEVRHRRLLGITAISLAAAAVLAGVAVFALTQRSAARENARQAKAGELVARAAASLPSDPERSLALALDASRIGRSDAAEDILRKTLATLRTKAIVPLARPPGETTLSSDGRWVSSAGVGGLQLYDRGGTRLVRTLQLRDVTSASFSADGTRLATGQRGGLASIYDPSGGGPLRTFPHGGAVTWVAMSRDGLRLLTVENDRRVRVFDARTGRLELSFVQPSIVMAARFSPRGDLIATGGSDQIARLWNPRDGTLLRRLEGHVGRVGDVAFSSDGELLATGSTDSTARVWTTEDGSPVATMTGHGNFVTRIEFSPDGSLLATASRDRLARVFDADFPNLRGTLPGHTDSVTDLAWSPDGATLMTSSADGTLRLWDPSPFPELEKVTGSSRSIAAVAFDASQAILSASDGEAADRLFAFSGDPRASTAERLRASLEEAGTLEALALSDDGETAASAHGDGTIRTWRADSGESVGTFPARGTVTALAVAPQGGQVLVGDEDGTVSVQDAETGELQRTLTEHADAVTSASFSLDGRRVLTTGADTVRLSDSNTGRELWTLSQTGVVSDADFSADERWVVTAGPGRAAVIDAPTGARILLLDGRDEVLTAAAFSRTGWRIATGGKSGDVRTYDCRLCGGFDELVELGEQRLAQLRSAS